MAQIYRQSPITNIMQSRQSLYRQPRMSSPRKSSPRCKSLLYRRTEPRLRISPLSPLTRMQELSPQTFEVFKENTDGNGEHVTLCQPEIKDCGKVAVRRLRKVSSKRHECTQCSRFRLQKYFNDVTCMICISCLNICSICFLPIDPSPVTKERSP